MSDGYPGISFVDREALVHLARGGEFQAALAFLATIPDFPDRSDVHTWLAVSSRLGVIQDAQARRMASWHGRSPVTDLDEALDYARAVVLNRAQQIRNLLSARGFFDRVP